MRRETFMGSGAPFLCLWLGVMMGFCAPVSAEKAFTKEDLAHWAFQPVASVTAPKGKAHPIDAFVAAKLAEKDLKLNAPADRRTWLRRAALDLTGLPPSPEEIEVFLKDESADAFGAAVDRLLASPAYGERWARHWLDLARYAESEGFKADETRPNVWRYRDYVIRSLNADKPYDRFVQEQIAGDELWPNDPDALVATGFNRHYADESNARNLMQRRQEILNDITDTVGAVFTGVTYACARCHDHKFDPILQSDYFRLQAFFANTAAADSIVLASAEKVAEHQARLAVWEEKTAAIRAEMEELLAPKRAEIIADYVEKYPEPIQAALAKRAAERNPFECQMVAKAELYIKPESHQYIANNNAAAAKLKGEQRERWGELTKQLLAFKDLHPGELPIGAGVRDLGDMAPKTHLLARGNWDSPKEEVAPGLLKIIDAAPAKVQPLAKTTGRRAALAKLLTDPGNPLTARVMANRIWHYHFGRGIVGTPSDFGLKGERPTHPELLDWLANEFVKSGWSMKAMHRLIMTSETYRQSSAGRAEGLAADPENKLLWRYPRHRLEGEVIRDSALKVAGLLNVKMGGPSVFPELPAGMDSRGGWHVSKQAEERNRRSIYIFVRRNTRYPMFETFDMPDTHESCARRNVTTSPLQALSMMNSKLALEWAEAFAERVRAKAGEGGAAQVETAFEMALGRLPTPAEKKIAAEFFAEHGKVVAEEKAILSDFCHMLLNSNEFVYVN